MSNSWEVVILVPEDSVSVVKAGQVTALQNQPSEPLGGMSASVDLDS